MSDDITRIEKDIDRLEDLITSITNQMSTNKEKYMPAVGLVHELKTELATLREDAHSYQLNMSQAVSLAQASTDSAHKRLDGAHEAFEKLVGLPETIRKDNLKIMGGLISSLVVLGLVIMNAISDNKTLSNTTSTMLKDHLANSSNLLTEIRAKVDANSLNISKTYQTIQIYKGMK